MGESSKAGSEGKEDSGSTATRSSGPSANGSATSSSRWWKPSSMRRWERRCRNGSVSSARGIGTGTESGR